MKRIRIGNDITLLWSVCLKGGEPYHLEGKDLRLLLSSLTGTTEVTDFAVEANRLTWTFYGKDQRTTGAYTLTLIENHGKEGMLTVDICEPFQLVSRSCMTDDGNACGNVSVESVAVESTIDLTKIQPIIPEIGNNGNWWIEGKDTGKPARGEKGEPFRFEDFTPEQLALLQKPSLDAAKVANEAAQKAETISNAAATAEQQRATAEQQRATAESNRSESEQQRITAEGERAASEQGRKESEQQRENAEKTRTDAESQRATAEQDRVTAEQQRALAESQRITAEQGRAASEQGREEAEQQRATAENSRIEAEARRATATATAISNAATATNSANTAAAEAQKQGDYAKGQGDYAKEQLQYINEYNVSKMHPTEGVGGTEKYTLELAIAKIPEAFRSAGVKCTFLNEAVAIESWQWKGGTFEDLGAWEKINTESTKRCVISQRQEWQAINVYEMKDKVVGDAPSSQIMLYESAGAKFNEATGYFELNTLEDISFEEMSKIYFAWDKRMGWHTYADSANDTWKSIRTNLPFTHIDPFSILSRPTVVGVSQTFISNSFIEVASVVWPSAFYGYHMMTEMFVYSGRIRKIVGVLAAGVYGKTNFQCQNLEELQVTHLSADIWFHYCSRLKESSILYMIQNEKAKNPITINLHPDAYARALADESIQSALAEHPNISLASA